MEKICENCCHFEEADYPHEVFGLTDGKVDYNITIEFTHKCEEIYKGVECICDDSAHGVETWYPSPDFGCIFFSHKAVMQTGG